MKLIIANKCHSSWSLRPWIAMTHFGLPFEEVLIPFGPTFDDPAWKAALAAHVPAGTVPALVDGEVKIWETLAILEYLAERFPDLAIWPRDRAARAFARAISSEMHAGFGALRSACPMNLGFRHAPKDRGPAVAADVARITTLWAMARAQFGQRGGGPFLFGAFTAADAMFAPVTARLRTYAIAVAPEHEAYIDAVQSTPAYQAWRKAALAEPWIIPLDEVDEPVLEDFRPHLQRDRARR